MTSAWREYPYTAMDAGSPSATSLPYLPIEFELRGTLVAAHGLVDSGATLNVLPYRFGQALGAVWDSTAPAITLTGNLARTEARAILVNAHVGDFSAVRLAFAWTQSDDVPVLLGQVNFFMEFDVQFFRSQSVFCVRPAIPFRSIE